MYCIDSDNESMYDIDVIKQGCDTTTTTKTINKQVVQGADDCYETTNLGIFNLTTTFGYCGRSTGNFQDIGIRWQSVDIQQGIIVTSAVLSVRLIHQYNDLEAIIRGIDEDNTPEWSSGNRPRYRTKTSATINANKINWGGIWADENWITIDIASCLQEVINRSGWQSGNAFAIEIHNMKLAYPNAYISIYSFERTNGSPKLDIIYSEPKSTYCIFESAENMYSIECDNTPQYTISIIEDECE